MAGPQHALTEVKRSTVKVTEVSSASGAGTHVDTTAYVFEFILFFICRS